MKSYNGEEAMKEFVIKSEKLKTRHKTPKAIDITRTLTAPDGKKVIL